MSATNSGRAVVTGASTGIGGATAIRLRELGFEVLACARRDEDVERLRGLGMTPLLLDVTDTLRRELRPHGVEVIVIEPGGVKTPIWGKGAREAEGVLSEAPPDVERLYGPMMAALRRETAKISARPGSRQVWWRR